LKEEIAIKGNELRRSRFQLNAIFLPTTEKKYATRTRKRFQTTKKENKIEKFE